MKNIFLTALSAVLFFISVSIPKTSVLENFEDKTFYLFSKSSCSAFTSKKGFYPAQYIKGESAMIEKTQKDELIARLSAKKVFFENGEDFCLEYYYSPVISDYIVLKGQRVNLHFAEGKEKIKVGIPLIFDSY